MSYEIFKKAEVLQDVQGRIGEILTYCIEKNSPLGYFAALYTSVARNIEAAVNNKTFDDNERLARMDVNFVNIYIRAMNCAFTNQPAEPHWQVAIDAAAKSKILVIEHLFICMNNHINIDLGNAVYETVKPSEILDFKNDFIKVNNILFSLLDDVQKNVSNIFFPLKWYLRFGQKFDVEIISLVMGHIRNDAFAFSCILALCNEAQRANENKFQMRDVIDTNNDIINHKQWWLNALLWLIRIFETGTVKKKIDQLLK